MTTASERTVPHSLESERALLGAILLDNAALGRALKVISIDDLYSQAHRFTLKTMLTIAEANRQIDLITLSEALRHEGWLESAGGVGYISVLTDGVPIGTAAPIEEYARIIKEQSARRRLITGANILIERALQGTDDTETLIEFANDQVADIRTSFAPPAPNVPKEAKLETAKSRYPKIRSSAWHAVPRMYLEAVQNSSEAADCWHYICFYTTIGALFGGSLRGRMAGTFSPTIYSVLVGYVGGDGKTGSMRRMFDFAGMIDDRVYVPRSISSGPSFIKRWCEFNKNHVIGENMRAILRLGELVSLLDTAAQSGTHSIIPLLNDAYDGEPLVNDSIATPFRIDKPHLSAIFASASKYLKKMTDTDLETGFGRRLCFCPGDPKPPMPYPPDPDASILVPMAEKLKEVLLHWERRENNRLELSPAAKKLWEPWYKRYKARLKDDDLIAAMTIGDRVTCQKIALINAGLDRSERYIEDYHLSPALDFGEYLYEARFPLFSEHGANPFVEVEKKILSKVPNTPERVSKRWVQTQLSGIDSKTFNDRIKFMTMDDGPLQIRRDGRRVWLWRT